MKPAPGPTTPPKRQDNAESYLRLLGDRVRVLRNQRGMTRKALAQHAKVSERYLAQLPQYPPETRRTGGVDSFAESHHEGE